MRRAQSKQAKSEKLEALGTLAAGAAHELASPLSTIAIVAKDLEGLVLGENSPIENPDEDLVTDVKLIREQVDRCRKILDRMAGHAGQTVGETLASLSVRELWQVVIEELQRPDRVDSVISNEIAEAELRVPVDALAQSLRGLLQNGIDVEPADSKVKVHLAKVKVERAGQTLDHVNLLIEDHGPGMDSATLARVSEPFFTTKPPGSGMGLGVFLATNVIERIGGKIQFQSAVGQGTRVIVTLPVSDSK